MKQKKCIFGVQPFSTVDYPNKISTVLFYEGCPLFCKNCHYRATQDQNRARQSLGDLLDELKDRAIKGMCDAVVLSGGEPLLYNVSIISAILKSIGIGYIGIHTSGFFPDKLKEYINDIDYIGLDFKHTKASYPKITGNDSAFDMFNDSLDIILRSGIAYQVRTTVFKSYFSKAELVAMGKHLVSKDVGAWCLQRGRIFNETTKNWIPTFTENEIQVLKNMVNLECKGLIITTS